MAKLDLSGFDHEVSKAAPTASPEQQNSPPGYLESLLRGGAQGATLGYADEAMGGLEAAGKKITGDQTDLAELYRKYRDIERQKNEAAKKENPKMFTAGELGGGAATMLTPIGEIGTAGKALALGATSALGQSDADLTKGEVGQAAKDTALGSAVGLGTYGLGKAIAPMLQSAAPVAESVGNKLEQKSGDLALGAVGAGQKAVEKEIGAGKGIFVSPDYRKGAGQAALENLEMMQSPNQFREKVNNKLLQLIEEKKPLLAKAQEQLEKKIINPSIEDQQLMAQSSISGKLGATADEYLKDMNLSEVNPEKIANFKKYTEDYIGRIQKSDDNIGQLDQLRQAIGSKLKDQKFVTNDRDLALQDQFLKDAYNTVKGRIEQLANFSGGNLGDKIKAINKQESDLIDLSRTAFKTEAKDITNNSMFSLSPSDMAAGGLGAYIGGPVGAGAAVIGKKTIEGVAGRSIPEMAEVAAAKGASVGSDLAHGASDILKNDSSKLATSAALPVTTSLAESLKNKQQKQWTEYPSYKVSSDLYKASNSDLQALTKQLYDAGHNSMANSLADALNKGDIQKKNAILFNLIQDPKYRRVIRDDDEQISDPIQQGK